MRGVSAVCTETFLRLPVEKRNRFLDAAWEEFSRVKFQDVSINQIIRRAGIPRGSFYQYFSGKEELFDYLLVEVQNRFVQTCRELLDRTGGDIFQAQLRLFDLIAGWDGTSMPMLNRCLGILQINPGLDLKRLIAGRLEQRIPPELMEKIDVSRLQSQDPVFVRRVFLMCITALGGTLVDCFLRPDRTESCLRELEAQLEIIQHGSLRALPDRR